MHKPAFAICLLSFMLSGCLPQYMHHYGGSTPDLNIRTTKELTLGVVDLRPDIVNGSRPDCAVGLTHHGMAEFKDFDVVTPGCRAFSETIRENIENALKNRGAKVTSVKLSKGTGEPDSVKILARKGQRSLLLSIHQWDAVTFNQTILKYELRLDVFDRDGKKRASKTVSGVEKTKRILEKPQEYAEKFAAGIYRQKLEALFNDPDIVEQF